MKYIIIIQFLLSITLGCYSPKSKQQKNIRENSTQVNIKSIVNNEYKVEIKTYLSYDTLRMLDYKEDQYSSPVVQKQELLFYQSGELVKRYQIPIKITKKETIGNNIINALATPVYRLCVFKGKTEDLYMVNGSDYCNGTGCPEFLGFYSMKGNVLHESLSIENQQAKTEHSLQRILSSYEIDLNRPLNCTKADDFFIKR